MPRAGLFPQPHGLPDPERDPQFYDGVPARRLMAWLFDIALGAAITLALLVLLALPTLGMAILAALPLWAIVDLGLRVWTIATGSATFGMRIMGIELRGPGGDRLEWSEALIHTLFYALCMAFLPAQLVSVLMMLGTARRQGLPDLALGTAMINRPL